MNISKDDIIYVVLLLLCIGFSHFYRKIRETVEKKWIGTAFGLFIVFFTSGIHSLHIFLTFVVCSTIIRQYKA